MDVKNRRSKLYRGRNYSWDFPRPTQNDAISMIWQQTNGGNDVEDQEPQPLRLQEPGTLSGLSLSLTLSTMDRTALIQ
jgi:hypothetical protein